MFYEYAKKGLFRRKWRTGLVIVGIAASVGALAAVNTISGLLVRALNESLDTVGADLVIQRHTKSCPFAQVKLARNLDTFPQSALTEIRKAPEATDVAGALDLWCFEQTTFQGREAMKPTVVGGGGPGDGDSRDVRARCVCGIGLRILLSALRDAPPRRPLNPTSP